ncbi:MAG: thiol-disulfide isomerase/thioredoxin [Glaciecola sp.]|jgi:thiol-disulfide isomerase/thioredoxin
MSAASRSSARSRVAGHRLMALAAAAALGLAACSSDQDALMAAPSGALTALAPGDPIASVSLATLAIDDTTSVDMQSLGGPAVVNFWATWCAFCVDEMADFEAVHRKVRDQVRFIGVDREDSVERALTLAADIGVTYELLEDPDGAFFRASQGRGMPTTLFVDGDGIIVYRHAGPMSQQQLLSLLSDYLDIEAA